MNLLSSLFSSWTCLSDTLSKRLVQFVLKEALGKYLEMNLSSDQINVELSLGRVHLTNVSLFIPVFLYCYSYIFIMYICKAWNEILSTHGPFQLESGSIKSLDMEIPWMDFINGTCELNIHGLEFNLKLCSTHLDSGKNEFDIFGKRFTDIIDDGSPHSSQYMSASLHIAQELFQHARLEQQDTDLMAALSDLESQQELSGVEPIAKTIEGIVNRFKVNLYDAKIRLCLDSHLPFILEFNVKELFLSDNEESLLDVEMMDKIVDKKICIPELILDLILPRSFVESHLESQDKSQDESLILKQIQLPFSLTRNSIENKTLFKALLQIESIQMNVIPWMIQGYQEYINAIQELVEIPKEIPFKNLHSFQTSRMPGDFNSIGSSSNDTVFYKIEFQISSFNLMCIPSLDVVTHFKWNVKGMHGSIDLQEKNVKMMSDSIEFMYFKEEVIPLIQTSFFELNYDFKVMSIEFPFAELNLNMELWNDFIEFCQSFSLSKEFLSKGSLSQESKKESQTESKTDLKLQVKQFQINLNEFGKHHIKSKFEIQEFVFLFQENKWNINSHQIQFILQNQNKEWISIAYGKGSLDSLVHVYTKEIQEFEFNRKKSTEFTSKDPEWLLVDESKKSKKEKDEHVPSVVLDSLSITRIDVPFFEMILTRDKYQTLLYAFEMDSSETLQNEIKKEKRSGFELTLCQGNFLIFLQNNLKK